MKLRFSNLYTNKNIKIANYDLTQKLKSALSQVICIIHNLCYLQLTTWEINY